MPSTTNELPRSYELIKLAKSAIVIFSLVMFYGCTSVNMIASWRDSSAPEMNYRNLLVVGLTENRQTRQIFEEILATQLQKKGIMATPSYTITGVEAKQSRELLENALKTTGSDAVLTARVTTKIKTTDSRVGYVMTDRGFANPYLSDFDILPMDLYGFYGTTVSYATFDMKPVEVTTKTTFTAETNLFDVATSKLIWSGTTVLTDPKGVIDASEDFSDVIISALGKEKLIP